MQLRATMYVENALHSDRAVPSTLSSACGTITVRGGDFQLIWSCARRTRRDRSIPAECKVNRGWKKRGRSWKDGLDEKWPRRIEVEGSIKRVLIDFASSFVRVLFSSLFFYPCSPATHDIIVRPCKCFALLPRSTQRDSLSVEVERREAGCAASITQDTRQRKWITSQLCPVIWHGQMQEAKDRRVLCFRCRSSRTLNGSYTTRPISKSVCTVRVSREANRVSRYRLAVGNFETVKHPINIYRVF